VHQLVQNSHDDLERMVSSELLEGAIWQLNEVGAEPDGATECAEVSALKAKIDAAVNCLVCAALTADRDEIIQNTLRILEAGVVYVDLEAQPCLTLI
jgi:hypothetical protein